MMKKSEAMAFFNKLRKLLREYGAEIYIQSDTLYTVIEFESCRAEIEDSYIDKDFITPDLSDFEDDADRNEVKKQNG